MPHSSAVKKHSADGAESSEDGPELLKKRRSTKCRLGVVRTSVEVGSEASSGN